MSLIAVVVEQFLRRGHITRTENRPIAMLVTHGKQHGINSLSRLVKDAEHQGMLKVKLNNGA